MLAYLVYTSEAVSSVEGTVAYVFVIVKVEINYMMNHKVAYFYSS